MVPAEGGREVAQVKKILEKEKKKEVPKRFQKLEAVGWLRGRGTW